MEDNAGVNVEGGPGNTHRYLCEDSRPRGRARRHHM